MMTSYFDEQSVQQRVTQQFRRRFFWALHLIVILGLAALLMADAAWHGAWYRWMENFFFGMVLSVPFVFHSLYFVYRELYQRSLQSAMQQARVEAILEREEKRKRDAQPSLVYLSDDGELVDYDDELDEDGYPLRRKRG